ncbi:MAG: protein kinase [Reyranellaceae bacterium]
MSDARAQEGEGTVATDFVALKPGQAVGRYQIVSVLGQGGFGITYRARDTQLGRDVALKEYLPAALAVRHEGTTVLPRSTAAAADFAWGRERFVDEGRTLAGFEDVPAVVRVFDFLEVNGTAYIVMQLLQGETLEARLRRAGPLAPAELERILWPLLDGLERVHAAGFLHRDIKPANIVLDAAGNPTLIDFGASRAAIAGRSHALTAIFTPGYAAAEQMTSAAQGPWTDIYGLAATFSHAITGSVPPSAFDRMLEDTSQPLAGRDLPGFSRSLLAGLDAGLAVRAAERPQSIAEWRLLLGAAPPPGGAVTVRMPKPETPPAAAKQAAPVPPESGKRLRKSARNRWLVVAVILFFALGGGSYLGIGRHRPPVAPPPAVPATDTAAQDAQRRNEQDAQRRKEQDELERLRAEAAARQKADEEAARKQRQLDEERQARDAEAAEQKRRDEAARLQADADLAARRKAEEEDRKGAEAAEAGLRLGLPERQHVQVALSALGYPTNGADGTFGPRTRDMIAAWQKAQNAAATGFLTAAQVQALTTAGAAAIARFDDDQRKAAAPASPATSPAAAVQPAPPSPAPGAQAPHPAAPPPGPVAARSGPDGLWEGTMHCSPSRNGSEFTIRLVMTVAGGTGTWSRPGTSDTGIHSVSLAFSGRQVTVSRLYTPARRAETTQTGTLIAQYDGANAIAGSGPEANGGGRICNISMQRTR